MCKVNFKCFGKDLERKMAPQEIGDTCILCADLCLIHPTLPGSYLDTWKHHVVAGLWSDLMKRVVEDVNSLLCKSSKTALLRCLNKTPEQTKRC